VEIGKWEFENGRERIGNRRVDTKIRTEFVAWTTRAAQVIQTVKYNDINFGLKTLAHWRTIGQEKYAPSRHHYRSLRYS
jgi:hypothetical protein